MIDMSEHSATQAKELERFQPLPIDPFGALPHQASRLIGLGGPMPPDDPAYVFKTLNIRPALGPVTFMVTLAGLRATHGTLVVRVTSTLMAADARPVPVKTVPLLLADLAARGGIFTIEIDSKRNVYYVLTAHIFDETDAVVDDIGVLLDRREESDSQSVRPSADELESLLDAQPPKIKSRPDMISVAAPQLAWPASQALTRAQFKEKAFAECAALLGRSEELGDRNWIDAYILQVLKHFVPSQPGHTALGIGNIGHDIPEFLAGRGWQVMVAAAPGGPTEQPLATHDLSGDGIKPAGPIDLLSMQGQFSDLDFIWSIGVPDSDQGYDAFPKFLPESMICLKPGGVALHIISYSGTLDPVRTGPTAQRAYARSQIERMALATISHGQEVAQLKFALEPADIPARYESIPFGIIARRQW